MTDVQATALARSEGAPPAKVFAWAMWDWGAQPLNTVIVTFVFGAYIVSPAFGDTNATSTALAVSTGIAGVIVALIAPVLGQNSDRTGHTVRNLRWQTWTIAALAAALFLVRPDPAHLGLGLGILAVASIVGELANVNYYALIDEVSTAGNVGRVSGLGWGMGYLGGIVALLVLYFGFIRPEVGLFGVTDADALDVRASMVVCGVWILLFTVPTFVLLRDRPRPPAPSVGVAASYRLLGESIRRLWRSSPQTVFFLLASALVRDGLSGVFAFGAAIAVGTFGFSPGDVIVFGVVANLIAGVSTIVFGVLDDAIGPRRVILIALGALVGLGTGVFVLHDAGQIAFWTLGMGMTAFVGPAQAASRSYLARLIPEGRAGEVFGLYATTGRAVSFLSPLAFGGAIWLGHVVTGEANTQYWGILGIVVILLAGLVLMLRVREHGDLVGAAE